MLRSVALPLSSVAPCCVRLCCCFYGGVGAGGGGLCRRGRLYRLSVGREPQVQSTPPSFMRVCAEDDTF